MQRKSENYERPRKKTRWNHLKILFHRKKNVHKNKKWNVFCCFSSSLSSLSLLLPSHSHSLSICLCLCVFLLLFWIFECCTISHHFISFYSFSYLTLCNFGRFFISRMNFLFARCFFATYKKNMMIILYICKHKMCICWLPFDVGHHFEYKF